MLPDAHSHGRGEDREADGRKDVPDAFPNAEGRQVLRNFRHILSDKSYNGMEADTPYTQALRKQGIRLPAVLCPMRTVEGRELRRQGIEVFRNRFLTPRTDGMSNTITSVQKDNLIMIKKQR